MTRTALALALILFSAGCSSDYSFEREEFLLRYVPKEDALLVLEVQHGLCGEPGAAASALQRLVEKRRVYPPEAGFIHVDFDETEKQVEPGKEQIHADFLEFGKAVSVLDARVFVDADGRLSCLRLTRLAHLQRQLELVNAMTNRDASANEDRTKPFVPAFPVFDEDTRDAIRGAWALGHAWLRVEGSAIVLDAPMTAANAAACVEWLAKHGAEQAQADQPDWISQMTSLEISKGHVKLRFSEAPKEIVRFSWETKSNPRDPAPLRAELAERKVEVGDWSALSVAQARLGLAAPAKPK